MKVESSSVDSYRIESYPPANTGVEGHHPPLLTAGPSQPSSSSSITEIMDTTTKAEIRKSNKPIMEKRRRARINNCLNDLKGILLEAMRKDPARHSKLEKADILELTVKHLQNIQRNQLAVAMASDPSVLHRFKTGFSECASEVSRYIGRLEISDTGIQTRLSSHLQGCVNGIQQTTPVLTNSNHQPQPPQATQLTMSPHTTVIVTPSQVADTGSKIINEQTPKATQHNEPIPVLRPQVRIQGQHSAFTSIARCVQGQVCSPVSSNDSLNTSSISSSSSGSDGSFSSDKGTSTSPIDFSMKSTTSVMSPPVIYHPRVIILEPLRKPDVPKVYTQPPPSTLSHEKAQMWRPW